MPNLPGINSNEVIDWAASFTGPVLVKGTGTAYSFTGTGAAGITDADYPSPTTRGVQYLNGTFYVMEADGTIWNSTPAADDPTTWPTDGFITAEFEPDSGVFLGKALNNLVAFGQWTTELFWDAGNPSGSPLSPVQNGVLLIGCAAANSVAQTESTLIWVAQRKGQDSTSQKGRFVAILVGTQYEELSTPDVRRILEYDDLSYVRACILEVAGHSWYVLTLGFSGITLVFDLVVKKWYVWTRLATGTGITLGGLGRTLGVAYGTATSAHGFSDGDPVVISGATPSGYNGTMNVSVTTSSTVFSYPVSTSVAGTASPAGTATPFTEAPFAMVAALGYANEQVVLDTAGNAFTLQLSEALDSGTLPIDWRMRSISEDVKNNERKFCHALTVIGDIVGTATALIRTTDDDYQNYSYFRRFDLSQDRSQQNRWGNYRRRAWEWRFTGPVRYRLKELEVDETQGVS